MRLTFLLSLIAGAAIGLFLPDTDRVFPFLLHRSIITHSALLPLLGCLSIQRVPSEWKRGGLTGLCLAMAIHFGFDLFPSRWTGFALIRVPFLGSLGSTSSVLLLLTSVALCLYISLQLLASRNELVLAAGLSAILFAVAARVEQVFWPVLLVLLAAGWLASCFPNRHLRGQAVLRLWRQRFSRSSAVPPTAP